MEIPIYIAEILEMIEKADDKRIGGRRPVLSLRHMGLAILAFGLAVSMGSEALV